MAGFKTNEMKPNYKILNRGINFGVTRVLCYNFSHGEIHSIRWDNSPHPKMQEHCVAIFKIKWK